MKKLLCSFAVVLAFACSTSVMAQDATQKKEPVKKEASCCKSKEAKCDNSKKADKKGCCDSKKAECKDAKKAEKKSCCKSK